MAKNRNSALLQEIKRLGMQIFGKLDLDVIWGKFGAIALAYKRARLLESIGDNVRAIAARAGVMYTAHRSAASRVLITVFPKSLYWKIISLWYLYRADALRKALIFQGTQKLSPGILYTCARILLCLGRYRESFNVSFSALKRKTISQNLIALHCYSSAECLYALQDVDKAHGYLQTAFNNCRLQSTKVRILKARGRIYLESGDFTAAMRDLYSAQDIAKGENFPMQVREIAYLLLKTEARISRGN